MGRSDITPIQQPDDITCGPASLKHALAVFGKRQSIETLTKLCKTNRNGTTTKNLVAAITKLGFSALTVERATLRHVQSALKYKPNQIRAVLVAYLYDMDEESGRPHPDSGHWAVISSFLASKSRIVLLDSYTGQRKSYDWGEFRLRWTAFDRKRKKVTKNRPQFKLVRKWQPQSLVILAKDAGHLPKFSIRTCKLFTPTCEISYRVQHVTARSK